MIHRKVFDDSYQRGRGPLCLKVVDTLWAVIGPRPPDLHSKRISLCPRSTNHRIYLPSPGPSHTRDRFRIHIRAYRCLHVRQQVLNPKKSDRPPNPNCRLPSASTDFFSRSPLHIYLVALRSSANFSFMVSCYVYSLVCKNALDVTAVARL
jgi:hypothetical protein